MRTRHIHHEKNVSKSKNKTKIKHIRSAYQWVVVPVEVNLASVTANGSVLFAPQNLVISNTSELEPHLAAWTAAYKAALMEGESLHNPTNFSSTSGPLQMSGLGGGGSGNIVSTVSVNGELVYDPGWGSGIQTFPYTRTTNFCYYPVIYYPQQSLVPGYAILNKWQVPQADMTRLGVTSNIIDKIEGGSLYMVMRQIR